jgi:hypothetical protein
MCTLYICHILLINILLIIRYVALVYIQNLNCSNFTHLEAKGEAKKLKCTSVKVRYKTTSFDYDPLYVFNRVFPFVIKMNKRSFYF